MIEAELPDGTVLEFPDGTSDQVIQRAVKSQIGVKETTEKPSFGSMMKDELMASLPGSLLRGSKDVIDTGAELLATGYDKLTDADRPTLSSLVTGQQQGEAARIKAMNDAGKQEFADAAERSGQKLKSSIGRIGGQVLTTSPVINTIGGLTKIAGLTRLGNAIQSGGMTLGGAPAATLAGKAAEMGIRSLGGGISGGTVAGLVNPEDAKTGALIGAVLPPAMQGASALGQAIGKKSAEKYAEALAKFGREAPKRETLRESIKAGYVVPPNMVNPSAKNAIIESFSGKQATGQIASVRNQQVTERLVRESLGLADDVPLTKTALEQIRKVEGGAYKKVGELSDDAAQALEQLKQARNEAQGWFNAYNRSASPADLAKAKEFRETAANLENFLEFEAVKAGKEELIPALKAARQQIAKTYTVQRALNDASGTVNAKVLGRIYEKGVPLTGGLETAGKFASSFPSVSQAPQQMGSPAAHNLRSMASLLMGGGGAAAAGPVGLGAAALPFAAGPASRALMFRQGAQQALANQAAPSAGRAAQLAQMLQSPEIQQLIARSAPVIGAR
jgi:hypothetical protein